MSRLTLILLLLLTLGQQARADEQLFYQPLNSDAALSPEQWRQIWQASAKHGVHTLIVQWTAYGDSPLAAPQGWLANSLRLADEQGLKLVLGLSMDPDYYPRLQQLDSAGLAAYWQFQLGQALARQQSLRADWKLPVSGWYLPLELDDLNFQDAERRRTLHTQLTAFAAKLDAPLHLSAFGAGRLSPQVNAAWLGALADSGLRVWWQDGAGTGRMPPLIRDAYIRALPCKVGVVLEAFRQVSTEGQPFRAEPAEPDTRPQGCHPSAVFSLRYRPWGQPLLVPASTAKANNVQDH